MYFYFPIERILSSRELHRMVRTAETRVIREYRRFSRWSKALQDPSVRLAVQKALQEEKEQKDR